MRPPEPSPARPRRSRGLRRPILVAAAAVIAGCLPLAVLPGATAAALPPTTGAVVHHYVRDHMGSGLAARTSSVTPGAATVRAQAASVGGVLGMDVSGWQGNVNWAQSYAAGARFAVVKATEGTTYTNAYFAQQYDGSRSVGMIRGAYHFALPNDSSGTAQADFFVDNGGGWSADGDTLPPALDIEYNPYGPTCYRLSQASMVAWIQAFVAEVHARTGRFPLIYSTLGWWTRCTGNSSAFSQDPLWIADYGSGPGTLPAGWEFQTVWQYADSGPFAGDQDSFNGSSSRLVALARAAGSSSSPDRVFAAVPTTVAIGGPTTVIGVTVTTSEAHSEVTVALRSVATGRTSATATLLPRSGATATRFTGTVSISSAKLAGWGAQKWVVTTPDPQATVSVKATMKAQSLLGVRAQRSGARVTVVGAARVWDSAAGHYSPWAGHVILVQRWTRTGWVTLSTVRADTRGNMVTSLHIPFVAGLRLVDPSSTTIWGTASVSVVI